MFKDGSRFISGSAILFYLLKPADILLAVWKLGSFFDSK
ncbi:hypothetical protein LEP1GSC059_4126 [Leptospira noguchii serovar Panama str. CZ214]|uniref:Uncharacterized protein n=1 Tax=Leptospira noguchii serovar Panama str. CZ214 TaxID=1001595 RepID=T0FJC1_9LEPT|nr:hypothetical protein LEP1GSC059_4126 [Leptospira noguchii serovar Panama str. CZ214]